MFEYSSVGPVVWMIDSMLEYVVFLYLGIGTFVWRNALIFELNI